MKYKENKPYANNRGGKKQNSDFHLNTHAV